MECEEEQAIIGSNIDIIQATNVQISRNALHGILGGNTLQIKGIITFSDGHCEYT